jgi:hypothetical protein
MTSRTIEGMCIAALRHRRDKGYIYVRGEYPYLIPALENALNEAREAGYLGAVLISKSVQVWVTFAGKKPHYLNPSKARGSRVKPPFLRLTEYLVSQPLLIT